MKTILILSLAVMQLRLCAQMNDVFVVGAMKNVMWKGELRGLIQLDTISNKTGLYGLGPEEYLKGELTIVNGKTYRSKVINKSEMKVEEIDSVAAPFFVYTHQTKWSLVALPASVTNLKTLEKFLDKKTATIDAPFSFRLEGFVNNAEVHVVNLPKGAIVTNPDDAHKEQVNYKINNREATLIGFFSRKHKAIFTHHDTYIHVHLITEQKDMMGHLEEIDFSYKKIKLFLPESVSKQIM